MLPIWYDVDDIGSLRRLNKQLEQAPTGQTIYPARHTASLIKSLLRDGT